MFYFKKVCYLIKKSDSSRLFDIKLKEFNGIVDGAPQYSELEEDKELNAELPVDILYDPTIDTFMILSEGKYYKMPDGMISNDTYAELRSYVTKNPETGKSYFDNLNAGIKYIESLPEEEEIPLFTSLSAKLEEWRNDPAKKAFIPGNDYVNYYTSTLLSKGYMDEK